MAWRSADSHLCSGVHELTFHNLACFNLSTGDVEDAPALDPIAKFEILEKHGGVYINGEETVIKASRRSANHKCSPQGPEQVVIVGG